MKVDLVWATPDGDKLVAYMARVSSPDNQHNEATASRLISFLIRKRHWSPFEMVNACIEVNTTRDIGRQILRHRSFPFQEFSQRFAEVTVMEITREARFKGTSNRQGSYEANTELEKQVAAAATQRMQAHAVECFELYEELLEDGIAPECARAVLPEGLTPTRLYMNGTLRSWIHYIGERTQPEVQKEHRLIAEAVRDLLTPVFPSIFEAVGLAQEA